VNRRLLFLIGGTLAFWLLAALPARHFGGGETALIYSGTAAALCLAPALITLAWASWAFGRSPETLVLMALGGMGLRLFVVLVAALLLVNFVPYFQERIVFLIWLTVFYLFTLALEMVLMLLGRPSPAPKR